MGCRRGDVVGRFGVVHDLNQWWLGKGDAQADSSETESFRERLCHHKVLILVDKADGADDLLGRSLAHSLLLLGKVNVCLINNDETLECRVVEYLADVDWRDEGACGVAGRADESDLDVWVFGELLVDCVYVERKLAAFGDQWHFDDFEIVDSSADAVHAVSGWADEDLILARSAAHALHQIEHFVTANSEKDECIVGNAPQLGNSILDAEQPRIRISIERERVVCFC